MPKILIRDEADGRAVTLQAPGGTGACRIAGDFLAQKLGVHTMWVSKPTWPNINP